MCGIFGMMLKPDCSVSPAQRGVLTYILSEANDERGGDSWGFAAINEDNKVMVRHGMEELAPNANQMFNYDRFMAHTRWATKGKKNTANAHPFLIGRIIGAHNGVLWNHDELNKKYGRQCAVDSMHLMHHLDAGFEFDDIDGYGVIEWFEDNDTSCIYLCQLSDSGELAVYGIGPDHEHCEGVVWSSDEKHLQHALEMAGVEVSFKYEVYPEQVYYAKPEGLFYIKRRKLQLSEDSQYGNWKGAVVTNYSSSTVARPGGWVNRPNNLTDEEWEEWKFAHGIDDEDEDFDVDPEIRELDGKLKQLVDIDEDGEFCFDARDDEEVIGRLVNDGKGGFRREETKVIKLDIKTMTTDGSSMPEDLKPTDDVDETWSNLRAALEKQTVHPYDRKDAKLRLDEERREATLTVQPTKRPVEEDARLAALLDSFREVG